MRIALQKEQVVEISFYNDKNELALAAFAKDGNKVLGLFKFTPGEFCLSIEENQTKEKTVAVGSKNPTETYEGETHRVRLSSVPPGRDCGAVAQEC